MNRYIITEYSNGKDGERMNETPEQQLLDMAAREEDPKLRELLVATVARKMVTDIFRQAGESG